MPKTHSTTIYDRSEMSSICVLKIVQQSSRCGLQWFGWILCDVSACKFFSFFFSFYDLCVASNICSFQVIFASRLLKWFKDFYKARKASTEEMDRVSFFYLSMVIILCSAPTSSSKEKHRGETNWDGKTGQERCQTKKWRCA